MSSELAPYAIHRVLYFVENDDRPGRKVKKTRAVPDNRHPWDVNEKWRYVYTNYSSTLPGTLRTRKSPPSVDYLRSLELALLFRKDLDNEDMLTVLEHGKPLVFDTDLPRLLVPKIIEAFQRLKEEPSFLDVTLSAQSKMVSGRCAASVNLSEVWPQTYLDHLPCSACRMIDDCNKAGTKNQLRERKNPAKQEQFVVEKFHIPSKHFDNHLTLQLHFILRDEE